MARKYLFWLALALPDLASAADGMAPLRIAVVPEPAVHPERVEGLAEVLRQHGASMVGDELLELRTGADSRSLRVRCEDRLPCLRESGRRAGLDQLLLVDDLGEAQLGLRVVDVAAKGEARQARVAVDGVRPDPDAVLELYRGRGTLVLAGLPAGVSVHLDGVPQSVEGALWERGDLPAGKHVIEVAATGYVGQHLGVVVAPGGRTVVPLEVEPDVPRAIPVPRPPWWPPVAVIALGTAGVWMVHESGGSAW